MRFIQKGSRRLGNKGLTMVELICAVAIVSLLGTAVSSIFIVGANSYRRGGSETKVQQEAQLVANQISDYVIDSAKQVGISGNELTIALTDSSNAKIQLNGSNLMYVDEVGSYLLAEGVKSFVPKMINGTVQVKMVLENGDSSYESVFNVAPRNLITTEATLVSNVKIASDFKKWVLEPNEVFDFDGHITSSSGGYTLSIVNTKGDAAGCTSDDTILSGNVLTIGADEKVSCVRVVAVSTVDSNVKTYMNVYVRRVNGVSVDYTLKSGTTLKSGARYQLSSAFNGNALSQVKNAPYDTAPTGVYYNTRAVEYRIKAGGAASKAKIEKSGKLGYVVLTSDLEAGDVITIQAVPLHTRGKDSAGVQKNRTNTAYDNDLIGECVIACGGNIYQNVNSGWLRQSNDKQASINRAFIKSKVQELKDKGINVDDAWNAYDVRFRRVGGADWSPTYRSLDNPSVDKGDDINIRPLISGLLDYRYAYEIEIRNYIIDRSNGNKEVWPNGDPSVPEEQYIIRETMQAVSAKYYGEAFDTGVNGSLGNYRVSQPVFHSFEEAVNSVKLTVVDKSITGIPINALKENLAMGVEYYDGSSWKAAPSTMISYQERNAGSISLNEVREYGEYRIKIRATQMKKFRANPTTGEVEQEKETTDYELYGIYPEKSDDNGGYFYFKVERPDPAAVEIFFESRYFASKVTNFNNKTGVKLSDAPTFVLAKGNVSQFLVWNNKNGLDNNTFDNNFSFKIEEYDGSSWKTTDKITVNGNKICDLYVVNDNTKGTFRILVENKKGSEVNFKADPTTGNGVYTFKVDSVASPDMKEDNTGEGKKEEDKTEEVIVDDPAGRLSVSFGAREHNYCGDFYEATITNTSSVKLKTWYFYIDVVSGNVTGGLTWYVNMSSENATHTRFKVFPYNDQALKPGESVTCKFGVGYPQNAEAPIIKLGSYK